MVDTLFAVGSLDALSELVLREDFWWRGPSNDVVIIPTAAAFTGIAESAVATAHALGAANVTIEALMISDRASATEAHFARRIREASLVVLCDGSPLHARMVWRNSLVGEALSDAKVIVAVGSVASVLCEVLIDPRGGAPTTGLGLFRGVTFCSPQSEDQLQRTRQLLNEETALIVLGPRGIVTHQDEWRVLDDTDIVVSRGPHVVTL